MTAGQTSKTDAFVLGQFVCHLKLVVLVFALVLVACGVATEAQQPTAAVSPTCAAQYVASTEAGNHIGQEVTVCGEVKDYYYIDRGPDKPTLLIFDQSVVRRGQALI